MKHTPALNACLPIILIGILLLYTTDLLALNVGYDAAGRVVWSIQPSGQTTVFSYDANSNIESITSITPAADTDADGLPDYFEIRFAGTATDTGLTRQYRKVEKKV